MLYCTLLYYAVGSSSGKLRNVIKSLMLLGANLSQSREFRDLFEDVLTKVVGRGLQRSSSIVVVVVILCCGSSIYSDICGSI